LRIRLESEGGFGYFPGLPEPVVVDTSRLAPEEAARLEELVGAADLSGQPHETSTPGPGAADQRSYRITVDADDGRSHTVEVADPVEDAALAALIDRLRGLARVDEAY
jgi:hypothetical protein